MSADKADAHILDTLDDDERQALLDHEEDLAAEAAGGADDKDEDDAGDDDSSTAPAADAVVPEVPAADAPAPSPAPAPAVVEPEEVDDELPLTAYTASLPDDFKARVDALDSREAVAYQKLEGGEIDQAELRRELKSIADERAPLDRLQVKVELAQEMAEQAQDRAIQAATQKAIKQGQADGIDYVGDNEKFEDLRAFSAQLQARNPNKSPAWCIGEAHRRVMVLHGVTGAKPQAAAPVPPPAPTAAPVDPKKAAMAARQPKSVAAPSLAQVPGGDGPGDVAGEFADILALEGEALEDAVGRMTAAQRARFQQVA
jgi:hypothetical protein